MTNYEKIKKMSADEIATAILKGISSDPCDYCNHDTCDNRCYYKSDYEIIKDWLEREVGE